MAVPFLQQSVGADEVRFVSERDGWVTLAASSPSFMSLPITVSYGPMISVAGSCTWASLSIFEKVSLKKVVVIDPRCSSQFGVSGVYWSAPAVQRLFAT